MLYSFKTKTSLETRNNNPPVRAGIIPFVLYKGKIKLLFGVYKDTFDLTDFGGGIQKGETSWEGAAREFVEETGGLFTLGKEEDHNYLMVRWAGSVIYFLPIAHVWLTSNIDKNFTPSSEIVGLKWYDLEDIRPSSSLFKKIWSRVSFVLKKSCDVLTYDNLKKVYNGDCLSFHVSNLLK